MNEEIRKRRQDNNNNNNSSSSTIERGKTNKTVIKQHNGVVEHPNANKETFCKHSEARTVGRDLPTIFPNPNLEKKVELYDSLLIPSFILVTSMSGPCKARASCMKKLDINFIICQFEL